MDVDPAFPVTPTVRWLFAWDVDMAITLYATRRMLNKVDQDGPSCTYYGCDNLLPTLKVYGCHISSMTGDSSFWSCDLHRNPDHAAAQQTKALRTMWDTVHR